MKLLCTLFVGKCCELDQQGVHEQESQRQQYYDRDNECWTRMWEGGISGQWHVINNVLQQFYQCAGILIACKNHTDYIAELLAHHIFVLNGISKGSDGPIMWFLLLFCTSFC
jgi:hypothetical protein